MKTPLHPRGQVLSSHENAILGGQSGVFSLKRGSTTYTTAYMVIPIAAYHPHGIGSQDRQAKRFPFGTIGKPILGRTLSRLLPTVFCYNRSRNEESFYTASIREKERFHESKIPFVFNDGFLRSFALDRMRQR
jgi:hypothetical protein